MITSDNTASRPAGKPDQTLLVAALQQALQATIFHSRLRIAPRRMHQIAQQVATAFYEFLEQQEDGESAYAFGQRLAHEGIGHHTILALIDVLHHTCWKSAHDAGGSLPASVRYGNPLLAGYMAGREAYLLQEQERARVALERARTQPSNSSTHNG
jgi:hypothetical protein